MGWWEVSVLSEAQIMKVYLFSLNAVMTLAGEIP